MDISDLSDLVYSEYILFLMRSSNVFDYDKTENFLRENTKRVYLILCSSKTILSFFRLRCCACERIYVFPYSMFFKCRDCENIFCEYCSHSSKMNKHLTHHVIYTTLHRIACLFYNFNDVYNLQHLGEAVDII